MLDRVALEHEKNLIMIVQPLYVCVYVMCEEKEKKKTMKKEVGFFFFSNIMVKWKCFLPGVDLFFFFLVSF